MTTATLQELKPPGARIVNRIHFVWLGAQLPCFAAVAVLSALRHNPGATVSLWHEATLEPSARTRALERQGVALERLDVAALLAKAREVASSPMVEAGLTSITHRYQSLGSVTARSNLLRLLILFVHGGIYLDTDTLTLRNLSALRRFAAFCGQEHLLWSRARRDKSRAYFWTLGPLLSGLRWLTAQVETGYRTQLAQLRFYDRAANNAVLGFAAGHPFLSRSFQRISELNEAQWSQRFRLGTHLLQELLLVPLGADECVQQFPPEYFYPLGPVTSAHYFRDRDDPEAVTRALLSEATHVVHWYASVANLAPLDETYILANRRRSVFAHLCAPLLE